MPPDGPAYAVNAARGPWAASATLVPLEWIAAYPYQMVHGPAQLIMPITSGLGEIFQFTVKNERLSLMQLKELLDWQIAPQLRTVKGIVEVNSFGGEDRQYQVVLDPAKLVGYNLSSAEVNQAISLKSESQLNAETPIQLGLSCR